MTLSTAQMTPQDTVVGGFMTARILLVDDAPEIQFLVRRTLDNRFLVESAGTLAEARKALSKGLFDLVLLDVVLPDGNGFEFFEEMRPSLGETPVLFLTGLDDMDNKVNALRRGAEDYLVKPVDPRELQARVEVRLSRRGKSPELSFGSLKVNLDRYEVSLKNDGHERPVDLTPHELKILIRLVQNRGRVLSRNQLIDEAWGAGVHVEERTVDKHVSSLRKKIGDAASYVRTVPGFGYMFSTERDDTAN